MKITPKEAPVTKAAPTSPPLHDRFEALRPLVVGARTQWDKIAADPERRAEMKELAKGQDPDYFLISCADSRYAPTEVFAMGPGHLFENQHVGAIIGRHDAIYVERDHHFEGNVKFAVQSLKVRNICILTHTSCGAVKGILAGARNTNLVSSLPERLPSRLRTLTQGALAATNSLCAGLGLADASSHAVAWGNWAARKTANALEGHDDALEDVLLMAGPLGERVDANYGPLPDEERQKAASAEAALLQREHLLRYPVVKEALASGTLKDVFAMVLELDTRVVNVFDEDKGCFVPLNGEASGLPRRN